MSSTTTRPPVPTPERTRLARQPRTARSSLGWHLLAKVLEVGAVDHGAAAPAVLWPTGGPSADVEEARQWLQPYLEVDGGLTPDSKRIEALIVHGSIARAQTELQALLRRNRPERKHLAKLGKQKGAVVVMDPSTGDTLAAVSYPWPS